MWVPTSKMKRKGRYKDIKRKKGKLAKKKTTLEVITLLLRVKGRKGRKSGDRWFYSRKETRKKNFFCQNLDAINLHYKYMRRKKKIPN